MQRSKQRKLVAQAIELDAGNSDVVREELIEGCRNGKTRATLRSRIERAARG